MELLNRTDAVLCIHSGQICNVIHCFIDKIAISVIPCTNLLLVFPYKLYENEAQYESQGT